MAARSDNVVSGDDLDAILSLLEEDFFEEDQEIIEAMMSSVNEVCLSVYFMLKRHPPYTVLHNFWFY